MKHIHLIAIGGSAMHNMALALSQKGYKVTGSDDEINEPSKSRLQKAGLLPAGVGWDPERITDRIDEVILGMHARADNPELLKAKALGLRVYSYPEYLYDQSKEKIRVVIGGSHGKTTITAMILHVLKFQKKDFDFMVGAQIEGFDTMVRLSEAAQLIVLEGDEYLSSPIDRRPKFHLYKPHIALLSGIAWDHINVFPTFDNYLEQFRRFIELIQPGGTLIWCKQDDHLKRLAGEIRSDLKIKPYTVPAFRIRDGITSLTGSVNMKPETALHIFGRHNLMNAEGARLVLNEIDVSDEQFYQAIGSFRGAANRLELVMRSDSTIFYKDFAHSPSKLKATIRAMKEQYPDRSLVAALELHTFSSLNESFLKEYSGSMDDADTAIVYFNPRTIAHKKLQKISLSQVKDAFARYDIHVFTERDEVVNFLKKEKWGDKNLLMMTSGTFDGIDFQKLGDELIG